MIMKSIQRLLDKDKSDEFERLVNLEIEKLKNNIKSVKKQNTAEDIANLVSNILGY